MAFTGYVPVTVDHTKCGSGNSSNYPVVISSTIAALATVANGGNAVNSNSGFDIRPYPNTTPSGALNYRLVSYSETTGRIVMVVQVATLDASSDTVIYLFCGDAALNTDGSSTAAFDSNFELATLLPDGSSLTSPVADNTSNANNGTVTNATATAGPTLGGATFNGTTADINFGTGASLNITTLPMTFEIVMKKTTASNIGPVFVRHAGGGGYRFGFRNAGVDLRLTKYNVADCDITGIIPNTTNYFYLGVTIENSGAGVSAYVNPTTSTPAGTNANTQNMTSAAATNTRLAYDDGDLDRLACSVSALRISNVVRNTNWLIASSNNLTSPSTFYSVGSFTPTGGGGGSTAVPVFMNQYRQRWR